MTYFLDVCLLFSLPLLGLCRPPRNTPQQGTERSELPFVFPNFEICPIVENFIFYFHYTYINNIPILLLILI